MDRVGRHWLQLLWWGVACAAVLWMAGCVRRPLPHGAYSLRASWNGSDIPGGAFKRPFAIAVAHDGSVYVTDGRARVVHLTADGKFLTQWGHPGKGLGEFSNPSGVAIAPDGNVYVSDYDLDRIQKFTADGKVLLQFGSHGSGPGQFNAPAGLSVDRQGNVYVADFYNKRIAEFSGDGKFVRFTGHSGRIGAGALHYPTDVAALPNEGLLVADAYNYELQWFDSNGNQTRSIGYHLVSIWPRPAEGVSGFDVPTGVAVGPSGRCPTQIRGFIPLSRSPCRPTARPRTQRTLVATA